MASLGGPPRATPSRGVTPEGKDFCGQKSVKKRQRSVEKRGRTGKKVWGDTIQGGGGDTRVKSVKVTVMSKKRRKGRQFFSGENK